MSLRRPIAPLTMALIAIGAIDARAQGAWPAQAAPIPGLVGVQRPIADNGVPQIGRAVASFPRAGGPQDQCATDFQPLREQAEQGGKLIKAASDRHAPPEEACKLIGNFAQAEIRMIKYVESHATTCGIPGQVADQLKNGHKNTENMQRKVCAVALQRPPPGPFGDFDVPIIH
jgi:hypothetical protein